jgi:hypothetical protein
MKHTREIIVFITAVVVVVGGLIMLIKECF